MASAYGMVREQGSSGGGSSSSSGCSSGGSSSSSSSGQNGDGGDGSGSGSGRGSDDESVQESMFLGQAAQGQDLVQEQGRAQKQAEHGAHADAGGSSGNDDEDDKDEEVLFLAAKPRDDKNAEVENVDESKVWL